MRNEYEIYLRPLRLEDASTSLKWRNNPEIWKNTGAAPDCVVTEEMEFQWLRKALADSSTKRFAICLKADDRYIGNVYLSMLSKDSAEEQIFIGEPDLWGKGIGTKARAALYDLAIREFGSSRIVSRIRPRNAASLKSVLKLGFKEIFRDSEWVTLERALP